MILPMVEIPISKHGGICCEDKECPYNRECANHATAGDFRSEGGFSPEFRIDNRYASGPLAICLTRNVNPIYEEYATLPLNYTKLKQGEVYLELSTGKLKSYNYYEDSGIGDSSSYTGRL